MSDRDLVDSLLAIDHGLTTWEIDFIESLDTWLESHEDGLTGRQRDVANRIFDQKA